MIHRLGVSHSTHPTHAHTQLCDVVYCEGISSSYLFLLYVTYPLRVIFTSLYLPLSTYLLHSLSYKIPHHLPNSILHFLTPPVIYIYLSHFLFIITIIFNIHAHKQVRLIRSYTIYNDKPKKNLFLVKRMLVTVLPDLLRPVTTSFEHLMLASNVMKPVFMPRHILSTRVCSDAASSASSSSSFSSQTTSFSPVPSS